MEATIPARALLSRTLPVAGSLALALVAVAHRAASTPNRHRARNLR